MQNKIAWMDIPVGNLERAHEFYSKMLDLDFTIHEFGEMKFSLCPHVDNETAFSLVQEGHNFTPVKNGPLVYLNVNGRMDEALKYVAENGGEVLNPKEQIGPYGFRAIIIDSEGNRMALHSYLKSPQLGPQTL